MLKNIQYINQNNIIKPNFRELSLHKSCRQRLFVVVFLVVIKKQAKNKKIHLELK